MYYSYVEIEYVATSFSPARTDLALKLLMTMGKGAAISSSNVMKCNTRSSTETELISIHAILC
jgi:hypothetical protein